MYLTRAFLDPQSRSVRTDLRRPESLHKRVMSVFPDNLGPSARGSLSVLHRLDQEQGERLVLLIQSRTEPMVEKWPPGYVLETVDNLDPASSGAGKNPAIRNVAGERESILVGRRFAFRLRANTTKKIDTKTGADGVRRHGRRVPVRGDDARMEWFARHAETAGFMIDEGNVRIDEVAPAGGRDVKAITVAGTLFEGILVVRDADRFRVALAEGIGPAKAYGFGLLSIAPIR